MIKKFKTIVTSKPKSKVGLIVGITLLVGTGIGIYVWYLHNKKKEELAKGTPDATPPTDPANSGTPASSGASITSPTNPVVKQSSKPSNVLDFQKWANKNKNTSLVEDGIWGSKTAGVWGVYGAEYSKLIAKQGILASLKDFTTYFKTNPNVIGKTVYAKYSGSDVFDGTQPDNVYNKVGAKTVKDAPLGQISKIIPSSTGAWVVFKGANKFFKTYGSNLNIVG